MIYNNKKGYSVIISMLLIGFLLILTTSVFNLVLKEYQDNRGLGDSIKAFAGAEASQELALLKIKQKGYGIDHQIDHQISADSIILSEDPMDVSSFKPNNDVFISYDLNVEANFDGTDYNYTETIIPNGYSIIPLFLEISGQSIQYVRDYDISINSGVPSSLVWNLIAGDEGISNIGDDSLIIGNGKIITGGVSQFTTSSISSFLSRNNAYLILNNIGNSDINFTIKSMQKFSKPQTSIISSAQVGNYKHNLETNYNNTEFLNMLKYAVFSD